MLQFGAVDVYVTVIPDARVDEALLSIDERLRADRFQFEEDRRRFIVSRAKLRELLARYTNREIRFEMNEHGKPFLTGGGVCFNVSHSGDLVLHAISRSCDVGVDVEHVRLDRDLEGIAKRFFSGSESTELERLPTTAFFNCWTRKEAIVKATGLGISMGLDTFDVPVADGTLPADVVAGGRLWRLHEVEVPSGYRAAVAAAADGSPFASSDVSR